MTTPEAWCVYSSEFRISQANGVYCQDLCAAALQFAVDTLKAGGHFVCKFYQGSEDKALEQRLKKIFAKVYREKPDSSRSVSTHITETIMHQHPNCQQESKEAFFVALRRKAGAQFVEQ